MGKRKLNADQAALLDRHSQDVLNGLLTLTQMLNSDSGLSPEMAKTILYVVEHHLHDICRLLEVQTDGLAEHEQRMNDIRKANLRVHELEAQLGQQQTPAQVRMGVKHLHKQLNDWWDLEGFGHISEADFGPFGVHVVFSCGLYGNFALTGSKTPVSDKERRALWYESLRTRGFDLVEDDRDMCIRDTEASRGALMKLFAERLPTASVSSITNHSIRGDRSCFIMREVAVFIHDYTEIGNLPVSSEEPR